MRILFLSRSLRLGGAERQLTALARGLREGGHAVSVAVFYGGGEFEEGLRLASVPVHDLGKRGRWDIVRCFARLVRLVRRERPDLLHTYLDGPNIMGAALRSLTPRVKVVWGVRSSMSDFSAYDWMETWSPRLERLASRSADAVIANAEAARRHALEVGFPARNLFVIPNGIDCREFHFDRDGRERTRAEWGVPPDAELVGMVARLDPVKNHENFLRAAARVAAERPRARFACVGGGAPDRQAALEHLARELGLGPRITFTGTRRATRAEYSAFEVSVLASNSGEGFPNVLAEAMACERPVAATDSGDARTVVADTGAVAPPGDPDALARAIVALLDQARAPDLGRRARERVAAEYSVEAMVRRSALVLEQVVGSTRVTAR